MKPAAMKQGYWVDWLTSAHAAQVAKLERKVYPADYRAGYHSIRGDLRDAEVSGRNLSLGVFLGRRLVGFLLAFHEPERARICEYLDIAPPAGIDLTGPGIYLNDFVVDPQHRGAGVMMAVRLTHVVRSRDELREIPVDTFSTNTMTGTWSLKARFLKRMSIEISERTALNIAVGGEALFWIVFRHVAAAGRVDVSPPSLSSRLKRRALLTSSNSDLEIGFYNAVADWAALKPFWNDLLQRTPDATVFQSYEYLSTWWALLGLKNELLITVILRNDRPIVIVPLQVSRSRSIGRDLRCLGFVGHPTEVDRNTILLEPSAQPLIVEVARFLLGCADLWDFAALFEQPTDSVFLQAFADLLPTSKYLVSRVSGPDCATVRIAGTWEQFLAGKPRAFRKNIKRKLAAIESAGDVSLDLLDDPDAELADRALERYRLIEASSWKRDVALGIGKSASHRNFYRQIVRTFAATGNTGFRFLRLDGKDASGTFGLCWARTFYSLQIAHDEHYADHSPGVVLTAMEIRAAFNSGNFDTFDFLGGFMTNKRSWATATTPTVALFVHRRGVNGWLFHWVHLRLRPRVRRLLLRFALLETVLAVKNSMHKFLAR